MVGPALVDLLHFCHLLPFLLRAHDHHLVCLVTARPVMGVVERGDVFRRAHHDVLLGHCQWVLCHPP